MNDTDIINLYFDRDEEAIKQTKNQYGKGLYGLSIKILRNNEDSEECVNDTFLKAWNTIPPQKPTYLFAYLAKICRHLCFGKLDYEKAAKRKAEIVELSDELLACIPSNMSDVAISDESLKHILEDFLKGLPEEKRLVFMRRYWFSDSISEIAKRYNLSQSSVKTTLFRTREKLKNYLMREGVAL